MSAALGNPRIHYRAVDSTNERARALAITGAPHGTLVTANEQSAGRGRHGRRWSAPPGAALLCSLVVREPARMLPLAAGVAVAVAAGEEARVKWPNDVLLDGRKVAGILVEARPQAGWAVLGIGVNIAVEVADLPEELQERAGTLGLARDQIEGWLARLLSELQRWLAAREAEVLHAVRARDALLGRPVRWAGGEGRGAGIDDDGRLLVHTADAREVVLDSGEVHLGA